MVSPVAGGFIATALYEVVYLSLLGLCVVRETVREKQWSSIRENIFTYLLAILRISDLATDLGVVVCFGMIARTERNIGQSEVSVPGLFLSAVFMFLYHRCMTAYGIHAITFSSDRGWLQLCDCNLFSAMYYSILRWENKSNSTTTFRWILRMGAVLESFPFAVIAVIFLVGGGGHPADGFVILSLTLSVLSLVVVFVVDDTDNVKHTARFYNIDLDGACFSWDNIMTNFRFSIRIIFRVFDSLSRTFILAFIWIAAGGQTFFAVLFLEFAVAFSMAVCPLVCTGSFDFISIMTVLPFDRSVRYSPLCTCYGLCNPASNYSERVFALRYTITFLELLIAFALAAEKVYYTQRFYDHFVFCWVSYSFATVTFVMWMRDLVNENTIEIRSVFAYTRDGQAEPLRQLLEFGGIYQIADELGQTPLHIAAAENTLATLQVLIDLNAPVDAQDLRGYTALMVAIENNHFEVGEKLIEAGSNPTIREYQDNIHAFGLIRLKQTTKKKWRKILEQNKQGVKYRDEFPKHRSGEYGDWEGGYYEDDDYFEPSTESRSSGRGIVTISNENSETRRRTKKYSRVAQELSVGTASRSSKNSSK